MALTGPWRLRDFTTTIEIVAGPDWVGKLCPWCQNRIVAGSSVMVRSGCETPHPADCWHKASDALDRHATN